MGSVAPRDVEAALAAMDADGWFPELEARACSRRERRDVREFHERYREFASSSIGHMPFAVVEAAAPRAVLAEVLSRLIDGPAGSCATSPRGPGR